MILQPNTEGIPLPQPTPLSQPYWDGCAAGELRYQRCGDCQAAGFGPAYACHRCQGRDLDWVASVGRGTLYSWTIVGRPPLAAFTTPYVPCIVRLDEGYDMVSALVGIDDSALTELHPDQRLEVQFHQASPTIWLPFFLPVDKM